MITRRFAIENGTCYYPGSRRYYPGLWRYYPGAHVNLGGFVVALTIDIVGGNNANRSVLRDDASRPAGSQPFHCVQLQHTTVDETNRVNQSLTTPANDDVSTLASPRAADDPSPS